jgi:photosystem II stability/assembly factor-like uncharacterized protein
MKKAIVFLLLLTLGAGCKKDPQVIYPPSPPSEIEGYTLSFKPINIENNFIEIFFTDEYTGYIAAYNGMICKTTNSGASWQILSTGNDLPIHGLYFFDEREGFAIGGRSGCGGTGCVPPGGVILYTRDGGQTWAKVPLTTTQKLELQSICFVDDSTGFAVGLGTVLTTHNRGRTWQENIIPNLGGIMMQVEFTDTQNGLIACVGGKLLKTTDGGLTWQKTIPFPEIGTFRLSIAEKNSIFSFAAGNNYPYTSTDFANSWTEVTHFPPYITKLIFTSPSLGFAVGSGDKVSKGEFLTYFGALHITTDGGATWRSNTTIHEMGAAQNASFPSSYVGFALNANGMLMKIKRKM